jgi:hypothetical protein
MMELVPDQLTPVSLEEAIEAFAEAHVHCMGLEPSAGTLACLVAQSALEAGHWLKMHCFNFGNSKVGIDWDGKYCMFRCNEVIDGRVQWFDPPHRQTWFRAFDTAAAGAYEQVKLVALRDRYRAAWHECCLGNAHAFALALGNAGYYTAPKDVYSDAVEKIASKILPACASYLAGEGHSATDQVKADVMALVMLTLAEARPDTDPAPPPEDVA